MEINEITEKYIDIMFKYFEGIKQSSICKKRSDLSKVLYIGINTLNRVFYNTILKTQNLEKTIFYSQKSYIFYLEYLEQIYSTDINNEIDYQEAILLIYKSTLFNLSNEDTNDNNELVTHLMTNDITTIVTENIKYNLKQTFNLINILCYWNNETITYNQQIEILKKNIKKIVKTLTLNELHNYIFIIENIQLNINNISYENYILLLKELLDKIEKSKIEDINTVILEKFYIEKEELYKKINNIKDMVKWILV